jgi:hypothetical protein
LQPFYKLLEAQKNARYRESCCDFYVVYIYLRTSHEHRRTSVVLRESKG